MSDQMRIILAGDGTVDPRKLEAILATRGELVLTGIADGIGEWSRAAGAGGDHDAVLVAADGTDSRATVNLVREATADGSARPVLVLSTSRPNGMVTDVLAAGADDVLVLEDADRAGSDISFALQKALARRTSHAPAQAPADVAQVVCVLGPKGGIGKTLTSANLGVALAQSDKRTFIVDLDLQFGDLGLALGLKPTRTLYDLATAGGSLDAEKVAAFAARHASGAHVLLAPVRPDQASAVTPEFLRELYSILREAADVVVVDTPPGFSPEVITTIDASSHVCMLGMLDAPSLKNAKLGLETLEMMGYPRDRVRIVLNRADSHVGITHADVVSVLGRAPDVLVPSHRDVVRSINAGEPLVMAKARTEAGKAFRALADLLIAESAPRTDGRGGRSGRRLRRGA